MGVISISEIPESLEKEINDRFRMFQLNETVLPEWCIRFHSFVPNENNLQPYFVGNAGSHFFYRTPKSIFIFKHLGTQNIAVENPMDFSRADIFCGNYDDNEPLQSDLFELIRESYRYYALKKHGILIHSSAVLYENDAIAFFGYSGAGKSTQAEFWKDVLNAEVLNYDQNYLFAKGNHFYVSSTPWGGKERYYINRTAPLKALVMVQKSLGVFEDGVVRLGSADAFSYLYSHNYVFPLDQEIEDAYFTVLEEIVKTVPVYIMYCSYGEKSVKMLYDELYKSII